MNNEIFPCLWCTNSIREQASYYQIVFNCEVEHKSELVIYLNLYKQRIMLLGGNPGAKFSAANSMLVIYESEAELNAVWSKLSADGLVIMPLESYPFADKYGWIRDKFGMCWQLYFKAGYTSDQLVVPTLTFGGSNNGKARMAMEFYSSIFPDSKIEGVLTYEQGGEDDIPTHIQHAEYTLDGFRFGIMDSSHNVDFEFSDAVSFVVMTKNQEETDRYWEALLSDGGTPSKCSWLKDRYGLSWQIVPVRLTELLNDAAAPEKSQAAFKAMLSMSKIDIKLIEDAYYKV
jgi:predicted 3-demethylubiquinone-9 3-methyltransferase (glyoxalase superfamily)